MKTQKAQPEFDLASLKQMAKELNLKPDYLRTMAKEKLIPCYRIGERMLRFDRNEVRIYMRKVAKQDCIKMKEARDMTP
jgi:excisionase family DNA binding protein